MGPVHDAIQWLKDGHSVGVLSESGMPGIADPGNIVVSEAQRQGFTVSPLVGPNSIILALSASGLNGQNFCFHGYLPIKDHELIPALKRLEKQVLSRNQTQIFIETPYRNNRIVNSVIKSLNNDLNFCVGLDITGNEEAIITKKIFKWKESSIELPKLPAIFLLGQ